MVIQEDAMRGFIVREGVRRGVRSRLEGRLKGANT